MNILQRFRNWLLQPIVEESHILSLVLSTADLASAQADEVVLNAKETIALRNRVDELEELVEHLRRASTFIAVDNHIAINPAAIAWVQNHQDGIAINFIGKEAPWFLESDEDKLQKFWTELTL